MKIIQITRYVAFDGTEFPTEERSRSPMIARRASNDPA